MATHCTESPSSYHMKALPESESHQMSPGSGAPGGVSPMVTLAIHFYFLCFAPRRPGWLRCRLFWLGRLLGLLLRKLLLHISKLCTKKCELHKQVANHCTEFLFCCCRHLSSSLPFFLSSS